MQLENDASPQTVYLLQSGLTGSGDSPYPNHAALFTAPRQSYDMDGSQQLGVPLTWSSGGVTVTKTFVFTKGSYGIGLRVHHPESGLGTVAGGALRADLP